jgi:AbrB family looped-hinge helix DNA binding protein
MPAFRVAKVHPKGQVVIPKDIRDDFSLEPGDKVEVRTTDEGVVLLPLKKKATMTEALRGAFKGPYSLDELERIYAGRYGKP